MLYFVYKALAVGKAAEKHGFAAVGTLRLTFLDPCAEAVLTGQLGTRGAHSWLSHILEANIALHHA